MVRFPCSKHNLLTSMGTKWSNDWWSIRYYMAIVIQIFVLWFPNTFLSIFLPYLLQRWTLKFKLGPRLCHTQLTPLLAFKHHIILVLDLTPQTPLDVMIFSLPLCLSLLILFPLILWLTPSPLSLCLSSCVHLEQLLSRLLQPQTDRDRAAWARPAFCCFPNVSVWTAARRRMDSGAWVSV